MGVPDAADLAASLRALAIRTHHLLRSAEETNQRVDRAELRALRTAILDLEADFLNQDLHGLLPYVRALRDQIELELR
jgi:hypothetical protein